MPFLNVADGDSTFSLRYEDTGGNGAPVVLIHCWPQRLEVFSAQREALEAAGYRVIAYDRAGFGESQPASAYDYDRLTSHLDSLLTQLELTDVTLVGWSMGGGEVARYAAGQGADRLRGVVFLAAVPPFLLITDDNPDGDTTEEGWRQAQAWMASDRDAFLEYIASAFYSVDGECLVGEEIRERSLSWAKGASQEAIAGCHEAFSTTDFRADLAKITVPAAIIHGNADGMVPLEHSGARTHAALPGSMYVVVEGAPHGIGVTHADEVNEALLAFLEETPRRG